jgi:serine/threonine protein kinase
MKKYITLYEIRKLQPLLNLAEITRLILDLQERHISSQFIHGDIKPENIVYDTEINKLRLIDFVGCRLVDMGEKTMMYKQL